MDPELLSPAEVKPASAALDLEAAERAVAELLRALGRDPESEQFALTPLRVAQNLHELTVPEPLRFSVFENPGGYDGPVVMRDISFVSMCEHHLLPFRGTAHVGYLPGASIVGLSALAHVVEHFARNFQVQERLTAQIADFLDSQLASQGVGVMIEAEHGCVTTRGVRAAGTTAITQAFRGPRSDDPQFQSLFRISADASQNTQPTLHNPHP